MKKSDIIKSIKGGIIVSCQALEGEELYREEGGIMPLMALAAKNAGAKGIRAQGIRDINQIKNMVQLPIIGIIKKNYENMQQYITPTMKEVDELINTGCEIIALDCTNRERPKGELVEEYIDKIKCKYPEIVLMADISTIEEGIYAEKSGVDIVGTTLSGYTLETVDKCEGPDFDLLRNLVSNLNIPVIAEGRIHSPEQAKKAIELGAYAVVVGGAITRPAEIAKRFTKAIEE